MRAQEAVIEARRWIGTPYVHQASARGAGSDCLGLLRGVWRVVYGAEPCEVPVYTEDWAEPDRHEALKQAADTLLIRKSRTDIALGDVLLFRMRSGSIAKHLGIQSGLGATGAFIHAYTGHGVIESPLSLPWQRRVVARYTFPKGA